MELATDQKRLHALTTGYTIIAIPLSLTTKFALNRGLQVYNYLVRLN